MQAVMYWIGVGYSVLSSVAAICTVLAKAAPKIAFFQVVASVLGTLAFDLHKLLGGEVEP